jgi:hypothetical protein
VEIDVACSLWIYWIPPTEEEYDSVDAPRGLISVSIDPDQVPEEARPLAGVLMCPGTLDNELVLNGTSMGPFPLRIDRNEALGTLTLTGEHPPCILGGLEFVMKPPVGWEYNVKTPSPLAERCGELGGCELQRLMQCPVSVGSFQALPPPLLSIGIRTVCCCRGCDGVMLAVDGQEPEQVNEDGCMELRRKFSGGNFNLQFSDVPACLMIGGTRDHTVTYGPQEPRYIDFDVFCSIFIYWVPPGEDATDVEGQDFPLWVAANDEQVPSGARAVNGLVKCPHTMEEKFMLDGSSVGPFNLNPVPGSPGEDDDVACLLRDLMFNIQPPPGFKYHKKNPTPLAERCDQEGGCELVRLMEAPVSVGHFRPLPLPMPLRMALRTECCGRGISGAQLAIGDGTWFDFDENSCCKLPLRTRGDQGTLQAHVAGVPPCLLPGGAIPCPFSFGPKEPECKKT